MPDRKYDPDLRKMLVQFLETQGGVLKREVSIGDTRADIVQMTNEIDGYEIKGDTDPLHSKRFRMQIREYSKVFDRCWLVISDNGSKASVALKVLPHWWGLIVVEDSWPVVHRMALLNTSVSARDLADQIWKQEWLRVLRASGFKFKGGVPSKSNLVKMVAERLPLERIRQEVIAVWTTCKSDVKSEATGGHAR